MKRNELRILWMSNAPFCPSGYGTVTNNVVYRLLAQGYNIRTINYYGTEGRVLTLNGLWQYPKAFDAFGADAAQFAIAHFQPHIFITLFDNWVGNTWLDGLHPRWVSYSPVDTNPATPPVVNMSRRAYRCIAMSRYGQRMLKQAGVESTLIPHGVDTKVYYPLPERAKLRKWLSGFASEDQFAHRYMDRLPITEDSFIVGMNAANKGDRKDFSHNLKAFRHFLDQNPDARSDARMYLHTWIRGTYAEAYHLDDLIHTMRLDPYVWWTPIVYMYMGLEERLMNQIYNCFDVLLNLARGGGFELALAEAMSCGVPCIATDYTAMSELVMDRGWLIPIKDESYTPLNAEQATADEWKAAEALEKAYNDPKETHHLGELNRRFMEMAYDYDDCILPLWTEFLDGIMNNLSKRETLYQSARLNLKKMRALNPYPVAT